MYTSDNLESLLNSIGYNIYLYNEHITLFMIVNEVQRMRKYGTSLLMFSDNLF